MRIVSSAVDTPPSEEAGIGPVAVSRGTMRAWALDPEQLHRLASMYASGYRAAEPFPHVVLDGVFPETLIEDAAADFPAPERPVWVRHDDATQRKLQWGHTAEIPVNIAQLIALLYGAPFLEFLEELTGIKGLIGDPHHHHGGLHLVSSGGFLKIHVDELFQPRLALVRRVNVIVYLNEGWESDWGGELELWEADMTACRQRIAPLGNRMVILDVQPDGNHGHPDPTSSPEGVHRRSIALYYYTSPELSPNEWAARRRSQAKARPGETLHLEPGY